MAKTIGALYQDGVFKPLTKVRLKNRQNVKLAVIESKRPPKPYAKSAANRSPVASRVEVTFHPAYRIVGLFKSGLHDLSKNHENSRGGG